MYEIEKSDAFARWFAGLNDRRAIARVNTRLVRLEAGLFGDAKPVGQGVSELRIDYGPGYRVYFMRRGREVILLLAGGDKRSQPADIKLALRLADAVRARRKRDE